MYLLLPGERERERKRSPHTHITLCQKEKKRARDSAHHQDVSHPTAAGAPTVSSPPPPPSRLVSNKCISFLSYSLFSPSAPPLIHSLCVCECLCESLITRSHAGFECVIAHTASALLPHILLLLANNNKSLDQLSFLLTSTS